MLRVMLAAMFVSVTTVAHSQNLENFYTVQTCAPIMQMIVEASSLGETILFEGSSVQFHFTERIVEGGMLFTVNQETGSWSLINVYGDGIACLAASGENFQPFVE